jgi:hypothetical protein
MGTRQRRMQADYLNTGTDATPTYALMGTGFTVLDESPNAVTKEKRYINDAASTTDVTGYNPSYAFTAEHIEDETAIEFIVDIAKERKTGDAAVAYYVKVDLDSPVSGEDNHFSAYREKVSVIVANYKNADGEFELDGTLGVKGDGQDGVFNTATKTFTPTVTAV